MIKKHQDFFSGLFFCGIGLAAMYIGSGYDLGTARRMGPGYFPIMLSGLMLALGGVLLFRSFFGAMEPRVRSTLRPALFILGGMIVFGLLILPAGLLISLLVLVLIGSMARPGFSFRTALVTGVLLSLGSVFLFVYILGQPVPVLGYWFS